jgi:hypothetical protein
MDPKQMNLTNIPTPRRPLSDEEVGKEYIRSQIAMAELLPEAVRQLSDIADSLSVLALYFEKKGIEDKLFTEAELSDE